MYCDLDTRELGRRPIMGLNMAEWVFAIQRNAKVIGSWVNDLVWVLVVERM